MSSDASDPFGAERHEPTRTGHWPGPGGPLPAPEPPAGQRLSPAWSGIVIRLRRTLLPALLAAGFGALLPVIGAQAADSAHLALDPFRGPPGTVVTARGTGFCPSCGPVEIDFSARPVRRGIVVGPDGSLQTTFQVPGGVQAGTDAVNAYQQGSLVTQTSFTVTPSAAAPTGAPAPAPTSGTPSGSGSGVGGGAGPSVQASMPPAAGGGGADTTQSGGSPSASLRGGGSSSRPPAAAIVLAALGTAVVLAGVAGLLIYRRLVVKSRSRPTRTSE